MKTSEADRLATLLSLTNGVLPIASSAVFLISKFDVSPRDAPLQGEETGDMSSIYQSCLQSAVRWDSGLGLVWYRKYRRPRALHIALNTTRRVSPTPALRIVLKALSLY